MSEVVFKILRSSKTFHAVDYNTKKEKQGFATQVYKNNFSFLQLNDNASKKDYKNFFEKYSSQNTRTKHKQFHAIISCKGQSLSVDELKLKAILIMEKLGYKDNPILMYAHSDSDNNHLHIITTRIDQNGKKINHDNEGIRANNFINEILSIEPKEEFEKVAKNIFEYKCSTEGQIKLLFANAGYDVRKEKDDYLFYKHSLLVSSINKNKIEERLDAQTRAVDKADIHRLRSIITKYQGKYDSTLRLPAKYTTDPKLTSDFTNFLKAKLGIEFSFFTDSNEKPVGYTVIDHKHRQVFKGSEILSLKALLNNSVGEVKEKQAKQYESNKIDNESSNKKSSERVSDKEKDNQSQLATKSQSEFHTNEIERNNNSSDKVANDGLFEKYFDTLIEDALQNNERNINGGTGNKKRKRRDLF